MRRIAFDIAIAALLAVAALLFLISTYQEAMSTARMMDVLTVKRARMMHEEMNV